MLNYCDSYPFKESARITDLVIKLFIQASVAGLADNAASVSGHFNDSRLFAVIAVLTISLSVSSVGVSFAYADRY